MNEILAKIKRLKPRLIVSYIDNDGKEAEMFYWPWPPFPWKIGSKKYEPQPIWKPY